MVARLFYPKYMKKIFILLLIQLCVINVYSQCENDKHPHVIDLGLPSGTLWSCCNLGAEQPTDFGEYYLGDFSSMDVIDALGSNYDVPTLEQFKELKTYCSYSVATRNDVQGVEFTGTNGNKIFLPLAASLCVSKYDESWVVNNEGTASYWTKTPSSYNNYMYFMEFYYDESYYHEWRLTFGDRKKTTNKLSIRPVFVSNSVDNILSVQSEDCINIVQNNNTIQVNISSIDNYTNWELYSIDGKSIQQGTVDTNTFTITGVNSGTYIISLRNKNKKISKKFSISD